MPQIRECVCYPGKGSCTILEALLFEVWCWANKGYSIFTEDFPKYLKGNFIHIHNSFYSSLLVSHVLVHISWFPQILPNLTIPEHPMHFSDPPLLPFFFFYFSSFYHKSLPYPIRIKQILDSKYSSSCIKLICIKGSSAHVVVVELLSHVLFFVTHGP